MEKNKRIYYCLMAVAAVAVVLTVLACVIITYATPLYTLAIVVPLALVLAVVFMMLYLYPSLIECAAQSQKRKPRVPYVPDPMGFRWVVAGSTSLGLALIVLCLALAFLGNLSWVDFGVLAALLLALVYAVALYINIRIHHIAGRPVKKRLAWHVVLEVVDIAINFFVL